MIALSSGVWLVAIAAPETVSSAFTALFAASVLAVGVLLSAEEASLRLQTSLMEILVAATVALLAFDWATQHSPVSIGAVGQILVWPLIAVSAAAWVFQIASKRGPHALGLRSGANGRWAWRFWRGPLPAQHLDVGLTLALLLPGIGMPLVSTGVLSTTLLKHVALAVLIARITNTRSPLLLAATCSSLALARSLAGYSVVGSAGPPVVEALAFFGGMAWLRRNAFRATLDRRYDR